jgi:xylan 1,4-beta-xylosidase
VVNTPFYGGYGLIAVGGIPKPAFNAFKMLHRLGEERIQLDSDSALLTRREDGILVLAVWNYVKPGEPGSPRTVTLRLKGEIARQISIWRVDPDHGDFHIAYEKMGAPRYPTPTQVKELGKAAELPPPEVRPIAHGEFTLTLPGHGLALIELK